MSANIVSGKEPPGSKEAKAARRENRKVSKIPFRGWVAKKANLEVSLVPDREEILRAVEVAKTGQLEERVFNSRELNEQLANDAQGDFDRFCSLSRAYNAARVAYFIVKGWEKHPIEIMENGDMRDGQHRLLAAAHMGLEEVEVLIF